MNEIATEQFDPPEEEVIRAKGTAEGMGLRPPGRRTGRLVACLGGALLVILTMLGAPAVSSAHMSIGISVGFGPPALPYYVQPPCPGPGYIWTPGYWAWDPGYGYYWVPGTWVSAPFIGALWTPGYWYFGDDAYRWSPGYWGVAVGYYGGINYGYGYDGYGYHGGYWDHHRFYYNRAVNRIEGRDFSHVYYRREDNHFSGRRVSYHGGPGGTYGGPTRQQMAAGRMRRFGPLGDQVRQRQFARRDPAQRASFNHGRPGVATTPMPGMFHGRSFQRVSRPGEPYQASHYGAPRYAAPHRQFQRGVQRQYVQRQVPMRNFQRGPYQARRQEMQRPQRYAAPRHDSPRPNRQFREGGHHRGHGHGR